MPYDFEMECKPMAVSKRPTLEIGNNFCNCSCTDVGSCDSTLAPNTHAMHESCSSKHMDVMVTESPSAYKQIQKTGTITSHSPCASQCSTAVGKDIGISSRKSS
ncbi:hypothetical protein Tco_0736236 [Tanacetum coccineum]